MCRHPTENSSPPPTTINRKDYHGDAQGNRPCQFNAELSQNLGGAVHAPDWTNTGRPTDCPNHCPWIKRCADAMLAVEQIENFQRDGQLTVPNLFGAEQIDGALADLAQWDAEFRATLTDEDRQWYLEDPADPASPFRKLDNPVFHRATFRELATTPALVEVVEQLIGKGVMLFFS